MILHKNKKRDILFTVYDSREDIFCGNKPGSPPVPVAWQNREKVVAYRLLRKNINKIPFTRLTTYTPIGILNAEMNS